MSEPDNVSDLGERREREKQAVRERLRGALDDARQTAAVVFFEALGGLLHAETEVRMVIGITYGDPITEVTLNESLFFALDGQLPVDADHRFRIALGVMKAADEEAFDRMAAGVEIGNGLAALQEASDAGNEAAGRRLQELLSLTSADADEPRYPEGPTPI